ncbi:hypothetical protein [Streptomyces sp. NPDC008139]|uniref:hypothetical protein n=1 Tax=Streptomyces sp. NPDC008139 TaxID=3364814 RepID=UPI0036DFF0B2
MSVPGEPGVPRQLTEAGRGDALVGLVMFGGHTYGRAAALTGVPAPAAARDLRSVLRRAADLPVGRTV